MTYLSTEPAIYGVLMVGGLVVIAGDAAERSWDVFVKVAGTVLVFWVAHVYASTVAHLSDEPDTALPMRTRLARATGVAVEHSAGMLLAAVLPLVVLLLGHGPVQDDTAVWGATWLSVALLGALGYVKVAIATTNPWARVLGAAATSILGLLLVLLKTSVH